MAFSYWQTGNFGCGFRAPANQSQQGSVRDNGRQGYGYQNYAPGGYGREGWNKWSWSASCLRPSTETGARLWLPSDLGSKLQTWLKGDDLSGSNGSAITTWTDATANANNATGAAAKPTLVTSGLNGMNTAAFAGASGQYFTLPTGLLTGRTQSASFAVYKLTASPPASFAGAVFGDFGTDANSNHDPYTDGNFYEDYCSTTRRTVTGVPASTAFRILGLRSKASDWRLDVNGTNYYTDGTNTVGVSSAPRIGATAAAGLGLDGQIAEIVDCNDFLTTAEKEQVEGYLAWKWGLQASLPGAHTYASAAPTVSLSGAITATASPALDTFLSASAAKALVHGLGGGTLNAFASTSTVQVKVKAAAAPSLASFTSSAIAKVKVKAAAGPSIGTFLSSSAAKALVHGLGAGTLNAFTSASAAAVKVRAAGSPSLATFGSSSAVQVRVKIVGSPEMASFVSAASAKALVEGAGSGILSGFGTTSSVRVKVKASAAPALDPFTSSATADVIATTISAQASIVLSPFISAGTAKALVEGLGSGTLNAFTSSASTNVRIRASAQPSLDSFTTQSTAASRVRASASITLGQMRLTAELRVVVLHPPVTTPPNRRASGELAQRSASGSAQSRSTSGPAPDRTVTGAPEDRSVVGNLQPRRSAA